MVGSGGREAQDSPEDARMKMSQDDWTLVTRMSSDPKIYSNLCDSIFPHVHGSEEIKKGLVLMLAGGVAKQTAEGTSLRGDINVAIIGDPSLGKSQFLRNISELMPRSVYTSGKASTAAGLTAAVVKDDETGESVIGELNASRTFVWRKLAQIVHGFLYYLSSFHAPRQMLIRSEFSKD